MVAEANTLRAGTALPDTPKPEFMISDGRVPRAGLTWKRAAVYSFTGLLVLALAIWGFLRFSPAGIPYTGKDAAVGLLRFQDGTAPGDQVTISTSGLEAPPQGSQYQAWLIQDDGEQRISIGIIAFDQQNQGSLDFVAGDGQNLVGNTGHWRSRGSQIPTPAPMHPLRLRFRGTSRPVVSRTLGISCFL